MSEKFRSHHEDEEDLPSSEIIPEKTEQQKTMEIFLARLREIIEELKRKAKAERPKNPLEGEAFEEVPTERLREQEKGRQERTAEATWRRIREEGINISTLNEFMKNVMDFSSSELQSMAVTIDDLIREWDTATHWFLRNLKEELQTMARLKDPERDS